MKFKCFLSDHGEKIRVGMVSAGRTNSAVEAFEATGGAPVSTSLGRELLFQMVVGDSREVAAQGDGSVRLRVTTLSSVSSLLPNCQSKTSQRSVSGQTTMGALP